MLKTHTTEDLSIRCQEITRRIKASSRPWFDQKKESNSSTRLSLSKRFHESELLKQARAETFTGWPHEQPSIDSMVDGGWAFGKVNDLVFCLFCEEFCHCWSKVDDPLEIHVKLNPKCFYVRSKLLRIEKRSRPFESYCPPLIIVHKAMSEMGKRVATFQNENWKLKSPSIEHFCRAGFFYQGTGSSVTCFACGHSLLNWSENDDPIIEHVRWFEECYYAKMICGDELFAKIQIEKRKKQMKTEQTPLPQVERLIKAFFDSPKSQKMLKTFSENVVRRVIEDQFRVSFNDFPSELNFHISCRIREKQNQIIEEGKQRIPTALDYQETTTTPFPSLKILDECLVCMNEPRNTAFLPCGHSATCVPCAFALEFCPVCRVKIQSIFLIKVPVIQ